MHSIRQMLYESQNQANEVAKRLNTEIASSGERALEFNLVTKDIKMKIYLITDEHLENIGKKHDSLIKTQAMCDLMLDIAAQADDIQTFDAALELANGELDRLELFFDTCDLSLKQ